MTKKILSISDLVLKRALDIVTIIFLVMNFFIWYLNDPSIEVNKYDIYHRCIIYLLVVLILNAYRFNPLSFFKDNIFFFLIFALGLYNSYNILFNFNGTVVDMGERSRELILDAFPTFLVILAVYRLIDKRALIIGLGLVLLMMVGYSLLAILKEHRGLETFLSYQIVNGVRHQSILNNPNVLGEYAFIGIFISLFLSIISKKYIYKILSLIPIPILAYGIILSGSRTGFFMVIALFIIINLYFIYFNKKSKIILIVSNIILFIGINIIISGKFDYFLNRLTSNNDIGGRVPIWLNTFSMIEDFLYKGIGYSNFTYVYNELFGKIISPHNLLIGVVAELGIFALIFTVSWFAYLFIRNHNAIIKNVDNKNRKYLILFNAFYITFFIGQMSEYSFLKFSSINTLFLALQAINFVLLNKTISNKECILKIWMILLPSYLLLLLISNKEISYLYINSIIFILIFSIAYYGLNKMDEYLNKILLSEILK